MKHFKNLGVMLVRCPDNMGLVSTTTGFISAHGGNIVESEQYTEQKTNEFFQRVVFSSENFVLDEEAARAAFAPIGKSMGAEAHFWINKEPLRVAILASKSTHCVVELLHKHKTGDLNMDPVAVIGNHRTNEEVAGWYNIPFTYLPTTSEAEQKFRQEAQLRELLESLNVELVVLARYMQVLSPEFCDEWAGRCINIHHSFLPAFAGANPYEQAYVRGVKMVGATAHYVTAELDQGPIIAQDAVGITHRDNLEDIKQKGSELETSVLASAVAAHTEYRVLITENKTVVFN